MITLKKILPKNTKSAGNDELPINAKVYNKVVDAINELQENSGQLPVGLYVATLEQASEQDATVTTGTSLRIGARYEILTYSAGDDFTNVGASTNAQGEIFFATAATPNVWTNGSVLADYGDIVPTVIVNTVGYDFVFFHQNDVGSYYGYFLDTPKEYLMLMDEAASNVLYSHYTAMNTGYTNDLYEFGSVHMMVYNTTDTLAENVLDGLYTLIIFVTSLTKDTAISMSDGNEFAHPK